MSEYLITIERTERYVFHIAADDLEMALEAAEELVEDGEYDKAENRVIAVQKDGKDVPKWVEPGNSAT